MMIIVVVIVLVVVVVVVAVIGITMMMMLPMGRAERFRLKPLEDVGGLRNKLLTPPPPLTPPPTHPPTPPTPTPRNRFSGTAIGSCSRSIGSGGDSSSRLIFMYLENW